MTTDAPATESAGPRRGRLSRLLVFEDDHLLVVNKPAGINTHSPAPFAGEGLFDWLRHREPRWAELAIIHRLDKETSGILVFGKTPLANKALTEQFAQRTIGKEYLLLTDRTPPREQLRAVSCLTRSGAKYVSTAVKNTGTRAETVFDLLGRRGASHLLRALPVTGRTHQIRVHAAEHGFPILGDELYGGSPQGRLCLHAARIHLRHPLTGQALEFNTGPDFEADARLALRLAIVDPEESNTFRLLHGAADRTPGWYVDQINSCLLSQSSREMAGSQVEHLQRLRPDRTIYHKLLRQEVQTTAKELLSPQLISGVAGPDCVAILENGVEFEASFKEGYSIGLFLDQRDNRRRLLLGHVGRGFALYPAVHGAPEVLNTFAYTCAFSVCAALGGARTTSLDLSGHYLEWGRRNFRRNGLDPGAHDFIYGDAFDWLKRLARKQRAFDVVILDPPTFSRSKTQGVFRAEKDFGKLIEAALPVLKSNGVLFASTNAAGLQPEDFLSSIQRAVAKARRTITATQYFPQPPDFPVHRLEPAYLKTAWLRIA